MAERIAMRDASLDLIRLAVATKDANVYAMAIHRCGGDLRRPPCNALSVERLAELGDSRGLSMLLAANAIWRNVEQNDQTTREQLAGDLYRRALALERIEERLPNFETIIETPAVQEQPVLVVRGITEWLHDERSRIEGSALSQSRVDCIDLRQDIAGAPAPPSFCEAVGEMTLKHSKNLHDFQKAVDDQEKRLGPEKTAALRAEIERLTKASWEQRGGTAWYTCEEMARGNDYRAKVVKFGELTVLRRLAPKK